MAECYYSIPFTSAPKDFYLAAKAGIEDQGGTVVGNSTSGAAVIPSPVGDVNIDYTIAGQVCQIDVTNKPFVVGCDQIKQAIVDAIKQNTKAVSPPSPKPATSTTTSTKSPSDYVDPYAQYFDSAYQTPVGQRVDQVTATQPKPKVATSTKPVTVSKPMLPVDGKWKLWAGVALFGGLVVWGLARK